MLTNSGARFRDTFGPSDGVRHVAGGEAKFTVKASRGVARFAYNTPFGKTIPLDGGSGGQTQFDATIREVASFDV